MKLLIIAGPYEADRVRKAAVSAGFETVAVEPGESLSGWITASRPELIVMAPQIVHADPALALAKVRAVPRGRVPIFLVGDAADEARMRNLADGFFVRPVASEMLLERARAILAPGGGVAPPLARGADPLERTEMGLGPPAPPPRAPAGTNVVAELAVGRRTPSGLHGPQALRGAGLLKPLVATGSGAVGGAGRGPDARALLAALDAGIDALFDAELRAALGTSQASGKAPVPGTNHMQAPAPAAAGARAPEPLPAPPSSTPPPPQPPPRRPAARAAPAREEPAFAGEPTKKVQPALLAVTLQSRSAQDTRARLLARYAPVESGDYFSVLGVPRDAAPADLRRAHDRIAAELAPGALDPQLGRELGPQIDAIRIVAAEALRVLSDDRLRSLYARHLPK